MKYLRKKPHSGGKIPIWILAILFCIGLVLGLCAAFLSGNEEPSEPPESSVPTQSDPTDGTADVAASDDVSEPLPALSMPYSLEDGKLLVESVYQFSGLNPDDGDGEVEDVAAIQLQNLSGEHLQSLTLTITTTQGTVVTFTAQDIPAGAGAMLVSPENVPLETNPQCAEVSCDAVFVPDADLCADQLSISVEGTEITLENISGQDLPAITIYCHGMLDSYCYGGTLYAYQIDSLPAGDTIQISALDCFLGVVDVVRVEIGVE